MSETLDREIRSLVVELVESSPQPRPAATVLPGASRGRGAVTLRSGLGRMAVVAGLVLLAGVGGALIGRNLLPPPEVSAPPVVDGIPAPEPGFSTAGLGEEVRLLQGSGDVLPEIDPGTLDGDVVAVGRVEGTDIEVFTYLTTGPPAMSCVRVIGSQVGSSWCTFPVDEPAEPSIEAPLTVARTDATGEPLDVVAVWRVPEGTSIVTVEAGDRRLWQRPVAGLAAFSFHPDTLLVMLGALSSAGDPMGETGFSPHRLAHPDEEPPQPTLEGAEEDLAELTDTHPAVRLLAEGATTREAFAEAALAEDLRDFSCASGGGFAEFDLWELCLVLADGLLAVVPFDGEPGLVVRIVHPSLTRDVVVPLDGDRPVGVRYPGSGARAEIEYLGLTVGGMSVP